MTTAIASAGSSTSSAIWTPGGIRAEGSGDDEPVADAVPEADAEVTTEADVQATAEADAEQLVERARDWIDEEWTVWSAQYEVALTCSATRDTPAPTSSARSSTATGWCA